MDTEKTATEIAKEICDKLGIKYSTEGGTLTLRGVPIDKIDIFNTSPVELKEERQEKI